MWGWNINLLFAGVEEVSWIGDLFENICVTDKHIFLVNMIWMNSILGRCTKLSSNWNSDWTGGRGQLKEGLKNICRKIIWVRKRIKLVFRLDLNANFVFWLISLKISDSNLFWIKNFFARACGVPAVDVRVVDCWQWRSGHYFHPSFPFFSCFFPPFFFPVFFSVATFSHRRSARIKKLI